MLPELIAIPADTAASFTVHGECTGRDIAWSLALLLQATARGEAGEVLIPDNGTRELLALKRRDRIDVENTRWHRLRDLRICDLPAPCVPFETLGGQGEWPMRHTSQDGELVINVDQELMDAFSDRHDDVVYLPLRLLQRAIGRYTVPMFMRVLAWSLGDYPRAWGVSHTARRVKLRIPLAYLTRMLDTPSSMMPHKVVSRVLETACEEITSLTDFAIEMKARIAPTTGRIRDIEVEIYVPDVEAAVKAMAPPVKRTSGSWRSATRPSHRPRPTAPFTPVVVSQAALDSVAPLSVKRLELQDISSNMRQSPGSSLDPLGYGTRDEEIEW